jgi:hypothetical protein
MDMNIRTATSTEINNLIQRGAKWLCVAAYDHSDLHRNDIISWHKSHDAACKAAGPSNWRKVVDIRDVLDEAANTEWLEQNLAR